jgi:hypothetical protein
MLRIDLISLSTPVALHWSIPDLSCRWKGIPTNATSEDRVCTRPNLETAAALRVYKGNRENQSTSRAKDRVLAKDSSYFTFAIESRMTRSTSCF